MSHDMRFPTMWYVRPAKPQISLCIHTVWSEPLLVSLEYSMIVKLLTEHHLKFLSLKGGCRGSTESTLVKMPHCWKSHVMARFVCVDALCPSLQSLSHVRIFSCLPGLNQYYTSKGTLKCLAEGHNTMPLVSVLNKQAALYRPQVLTTPPT